METAILHSPSISCQGCARAINTALSALDGVESVKVDISDKAISVTFDPGRVTLNEIRRCLSQAGFDT